jgi:hypothetical protein
MDVCPIVFTNSGGALPTGITSGTTYWTVPSSYTTNTFQIATSATNAIAGTSVNTSGSQSGTQTGTRGAGLVNNTAKTITGRSLTAGDWDVWCAPKVQAVGTSLTYFASEITTGDNTVPGVIGNFSKWMRRLPLAGSWHCQLRKCRFRLSSTTSYFCTTLEHLAAGSVTATAR